MGKCHITVLKCTLDMELKEKYIDDPNYGVCPYFTPGQEFDSTGDRPEGFGCKIGWKSIQDEVKGICGDNPFFQHQVVCCNDGVRPVLFLIQHRDE